jgi:uncharacterized membrane protein
MKGIKDLRNGFYSAFSTEITSLRRFLDSYPLLSLGIVFLIGIIVGGLLSAWPSQFVILALVGGFGFAIALGSTLGIPSYVSILLVIPILAFTTYAGLRILHSIEKYARLAPYLLSMRKRYGPTSLYLVEHVGAFGVVGVIALSTFVIGWWVTIIVAYLLNARVPTAMKGTGLGLIIGAVFFWASFEGLTRWIPDPRIITAITLVLFIVLAKIITHNAEHRRDADRNSSKITTGAV